MALPAVLTAMRQIILDLEELPASPEARLKLYRKRFPDLSPHELEDLSKIENNGFKTYTTSIFQGEKGVIFNHFPVTLNILQSHWENVRGTPFKPFELARQLHRRYPWKSYTTEALLQNFVSFVQTDLKNIEALAPGISEMARFEYLIFEIKRAPDDNLGDVLTVEQLNALTVEQALALKLFIRANVRFDEFRYDVLGARRSYLRQKSTITALSPLHCLLIGGRNGAHLVEWVVAEPHIYRFIKENPRSHPLNLEDLAACVVEHSVKSAQEETFVEFLSVVVELMRCGLIALKQ